MDRIVLKHRLMQDFAEADAQLARDIEGMPPEDLTKLVMHFARMSHRLLRAGIDSPAFAAEMDRIVEMPLAD